MIMNPPFTRDSLRHDQFSREDERKIKAREKALFANKPVHLSSNGNAFLVLADYISRADAGAIASILPLVTSTNASSLEIRKYLASSFHIETIVTSHDPERIYFSENTSIGEMLLICRRWPADGGPKPPTRVANLAVNPATPSASLLPTPSRTAVWQPKEQERCKSGRSGKSRLAIGAGCSFSRRTCVRNSQT